MLKNEKSANRIEHQNRKTDIFWHNNRKPDQKNKQTAKPKITMPPSINFVVLWLRKLRNYHEMYMNSKRKKASFITDKARRIYSVSPWKEFFQGNRY